MANVLSPTIVDACQRLALPLLYVVTVNHRYRNACKKMLEDWVRLNITSGCVFCLDDVVYANLRAQFPSIPMFVVPYDVQKPDNIFWSFRLQILADLLAADVPTVMVDVDTEWVQDPTPYVESLLSHTDMAISQGRDYPEGVYKHQGFTLCSGFMAVQPTPGTREFVDAWLQLTATVEDDDVALNRILSTRSVGARFQFPPAALNGRAVRGYPEPVPATWTRGDTVVNVLVLPWRLFPRAQLASGAENVLVAHYHERKW